jgi:EAL domain-containing protein (putative c-di-GMP-specific phosphodiesterase class I)/GGDEF domain-containing protein/CBS domain-containing protein
MVNLRDELIKVLNREALTAHFQPIVSLTQRDIIGYEVLVHGPVKSPLYDTVTLFDTARTFNLSAKLEFICLKIALRRYADLCSHKKLFINVNPSTLLEEDFKNSVTLKFIDQYCLDPRSIVIELTENQPLDNAPLICKAVTYYRSMGFEIALDNLGVGYSGLCFWAEVQPEYVKMDRYFMADLPNNPFKLNFVRSIQNMANALDCHLIVEGVETENEVLALVELGITHVQGNYFAKPTLDLLEKIESTRFIKDLSGKAVAVASSLTTPPLEAGDNAFLINDSSCCPVALVHLTTVSQIAKVITPVSSDTPISEVMQLFQIHHDLTMLPLVDNKVASGIVFRDHFLSRLFSSRYGIELYGKKPIKIFVEKTPLAIEHHISIELASQQITSTSDNDPAFIITNNGSYAGIGTVLDLLEEITRQKIDDAKHANPLTLLPGSVPINSYINQLLANHHAFSVGYFDLDNFKPFNDAYSYSAGDDMIKAVADTLIQHIAKEDGMIGHIGGDDFIVVFTSPDWLRCCKYVLTHFGQIVPSYYNDKDVNNGGIFAENRSGELVFFPMITLSVGIVDPISTSSCQSHVDIADLASGAKKQAKKITGNSFYINKREMGDSQKRYPA